MVDDDVSVTSRAAANASGSSVAMTITADMQNTSAGMTTTTPEFISGSTASQLSSTGSDSFTGLQFNDTIRARSEAT